MRRVLLISLSLVLALVGWSTVCADDGFYVVAAKRGKYASVPKTGQTVSYVTNGTEDDGALQKGEVWPTPRFTDNGNGTVTDNLTGLIWMKNANAFGGQIWADALSDAKNLQAGYSGLVDGSKPGDWRLPNIRELQSLIDYGSAGPALPAGNPFTGVPQLSVYWSSTTDAGDITKAWYVHFDGGGYVYNSDKSSGCYVWCVRGGP